MRTVLADWLERKGMTQVEFARLSGIPGPSVNHYCHAKRRPGLTHALAIEGTTGIAPAYWRDLSVESDREPDDDSPAPETPHPETR